MSELGQKAKYSLGVDVFRFTPESGLMSDIAPCPFRASSGHCCSVCRRSRPNPSWPLLALRDMDQERTSQPRRRALCGDEWPEGTTPTEASTLTDTSLSTIASRLKCTPKGSFLGL